MSSTEPDTPAVAAARATLTEYDKLTAAGGWADLTGLERGIWVGRLAACLRYTLAIIDGSAS